MNLDLSSIDQFWSLINSKLNSWLELGIENIPNFVVACAVVILFAGLSRLVAMLLRRLFRRSMDSRQIADLFVAIIRVLILGVGVFIALEVVGLKGTVTSLLAGAGIIGLALGFAFQDITENLIAGIAMGIRKPFRIGDIIATERIFGTVEAINLRNTVIETFFGQMDIVPNKLLFRDVVTNYSRYQKRRIEVPVGISYADDPEVARECIVETINGLDCVIDKDQTQVYAESFGDSSVKLLVWFWIHYPGETGFMEARHQAVVNIKRALEKADILIPFPIRTLDFNARGGEKLDAMVRGYQSKETARDGGSGQ